MEGLLRPGMVVDGFRLEERLHQGSMATIWRVSGPGGEPLLMKTPLVREGDDPTAIVGFEGEQMILPTLSGVHLPRFVASGDFTEQPYIVMELIPGGSLRQRRLDAAPLPGEEVATIGARVADALHALHRQHVIHLDLKPSNVLFRESGEAVLIDLGLAHHDHLPDLLAEQFRLPMGTGPYISPEQIRGVRNDLRSDLFALGVMLYHLATGVRPFGQPTTVRGLRRRLHRDPVPPRARVPSVPPWLQEIILHCLEVDPDQRYQTAAQVAWDLQHPDQVRLTARAERRKRDGALTVVRRWGRNLGRSPDPGHSAAGQLDSAPIVLVAIDVTQGEADLLAALRVTARRVFETEPGSRLACMTVLKTSRFAVDFDVDPEGHNVRVVRLVKLKHWARLLGVPEGRLTYHVLESPDPARAIIEFARANKVDHLVIGARGSSALRRYLGSVSSQVVAEADCTVTVVKSPVGAPGPPG